MEPDDNDIVFEYYSPDLLGLVHRIFDFVTGNTTTANGGQSAFDSFLMLLLQIWNIYSVFAFILSAIFIFGIIYAFIRFNQLSEIESNQLFEAEALWKQLHGDGGGHSEWKSVVAHIDSNNPNDWKLGIIEADIMLDKLLIERGFAGLSLGERLKSASPQSFTTLQDAWEAHLVRNKIAHQGADFVLTQKLARDTMIRYQKVFTEFGVV